MDIHARIQAFLQQQTIIAMTAGAEEGDFLKAGIVPFMRSIPSPTGGGSGWGHNLALTEQNYAPLPASPLRGEEQCLYYLMKPVARHNHLAPPDFQLCKGTRMQRLPDGSWRDRREGESMPPEQESLAATALREGVEELGLVLSNIRRLFDLGPYGFASAATGREKRMWLFAAEVASAAAFLPASEVESATAERRWLSAAEFAVAGRPDHRYILHDIEQRITAHGG